MKGRRRRRAYIGLLPQEVRHRIALNGVNVFREDVAIHAKCGKYATMG